MTGPGTAPLPLAIAPLSSYVVHSSSLLRPKPRYLALSANQSCGAVGAGGRLMPQSHSMKTRRATSYRSVQRAEQVEGLAPDGQVRLLPPDRLTRLCIINRRDKLQLEQPEPFVARCARAEFFHQDAWLD